MLLAVLLLQSEGGESIARSWLQWLPWRVTHLLNDLVDGGIGLLEVLGEDLLLCLERCGIAAPLSAEHSWVVGRSWSGGAAGELAQRGPAGKGGGGLGGGGGSGRGGGGRWEWEVQGVPGTLLSGQ